MYPAASSAIACFDTTESLNPLASRAALNYTSCAAATTAISDSRATSGAGPSARRRGAVAGPHPPDRGLPALDPSTG
jgi:hypothetical protein